MELAHPKIILTKEEIMGRAIEHEKSIDEINMRLNQLTHHVLMLQDTIEEMIRLASEKPEKETKKKTTKKKDK